MTDHRVPGRLGTGSILLALCVLVPACDSTPAASRDTKSAEVESEDWRAGEPLNTEEYDRIDENPFLEVRRNPLSTFSVDVDTASYSNVRRYLADGLKPPADAVRIEELVNYFRYGYPPPGDDRPFSVTTEIAECPWNDGHRLLHLGIRARTVSEENLPPRNLVFLLDVSGSMDTPRKLPLVKRAMKLLVERLTERDTVAIVVYAGASGLVLPPTPGSEREAILEALDRLEAGGSTNGGEGIRLAYRTAREGYRENAINRVVLATDGDFNVGTTNRGDLTRLIEKEREGGIFLTVLGFGSGNLKDSTMESLADRGNGNYAYVDGISEARKVLVAEAGGTLVTIAKDVKLQVEFNPERVGAYRLIGYENRLLRVEDFADDRKDAGEIGAGHTVTALYEITLPGEVPTEGAVDPLKYQTPGAPTPAAASAELVTVKVRYKEPTGETSRLLTFPVEDPSLLPWRESSDAFRFSAAVAAFGMLLRNSAHKGNASYAMVLDLARDARGQDPHGYRGEFVRMVETASDL